MRKKIVFMINSSYPFYTGGRETWLNNVTNRLADQYEVVIIAENHVNKSNTASRWEIAPKIKMINVNSLLSYRFTNRILRSYIYYVHCFFCAHMMYKALRKVLKKTPKAIVVAMDTVFVPLAFRGKLKKNSNYSLIISSRGPHAEIYGSYWPLMKSRLLKIEKNNFENADMIWSNGYDTQKQIKEKGYDSTVIYNGVDCKKILSTNLPPHEKMSKFKGYKILTIGSLLDIKGYPTMIKALRIIKETSPFIEIDFFSFGKGNSERYMQLAENNHVEKNVHFLGEDKEAPIYAKQADVLLAMGTREGGGMSMATLEMLATGVPVIANDVPCYRQLITDKENGFLTKEDDPKELAQSIIHILQLNEDEKRRITKAAQHRAMENDWFEVLQQVKMEIEKL